MSDELFKQICTVDGPKTDPWDDFEATYPPLTPPKETVLPPLKGQPIPPGRGTGGSGSGSGGGVSGGDAGGGVAGGGGGKAPAGLPSGWEMYKESEVGFTIFMKAGAAKMEELGVMGGIMKGFRLSNDSDKMVYYAAGQLAPIGAPELDPIKAFEDVKSGLGQLGTKVEVTDEKKIKLGKHEGREHKVTVHMQGGFSAVMYQRTYVVEDRIYVLRIGLKDISPKSAEYSQFFNSFKLTTPGK